jgi:hypothetical protein
MFGGVFRYGLEEVGNTIMTMTYTKKMRNQNAKLNATEKMEKSQVKQIVKSMIGNDVETKYFDQFSAGSIPVAGTITNISDITRGAEVTQRVGNQVTLKHITVKLTTNIHPSAVNGYVRLVLVLDKQGFNAPVIADVFETAYLSSPFTAVAPTTWDYRKRFKILFDNKVLLTQAAFTAGSLTCDLPLNIKSQHIGAGTTFQNQLYLILLSTEQNVLALPGFYWQSRLQFTDE